MSKNQRTYLLLAGVLIIWGLLGFRILSAVHSPEPETMENRAPAFSPVRNSTKDTFGIVADYRDPFLGTYPVQEKTPARAVKATTPPPPSKNIIYTGLVRDETSKKTLFFVTIDGQAHLLSPKQEAAGVTLVRGNKDQIRVSYGGRTQEIDRTQ